MINARHCTAARRMSVAAVAFTPITATRAHAQSTPRWIATWAPSMQPAAPRPPADSVDRVYSVINRTLRQIAHVSLGGTRVRIRLSNEYGDRPLMITNAHIALAKDGATIDSTTDRPLTFNGRRSVVIRPGANLVSDAVPLRIPSLSDVAVSLAISDTARTVTRHALALQTNYVSAPGDVAAATTFTPDTTLRVWSFLAGIDVVNPAATGVIVAIGNSITDGTASPPDVNTRWPDVLARRLLTSREPPKAVVNAGISGNRVLSNVTGPSALLRFDRDVLMQPGVTHVIVLEGINDIARGSKPADPREEVSVEELIAGHQQLIDRAHARGLRIYGATLTPVGGLNRPATEERNAKHALFNKWIRTSGAYDGVIDFEKATWDPSDTTRFLPAYDSGDHLHPNGAGYTAMGNAIALLMFRTSTKPK
jgi:lysophospholipase L1-like esterase